MAALGKAVSSSPQGPSPQTYIPLAVAMCIFRPSGPRCGRAQERQRPGRGLAAGGRQFPAGPLWGLGQVPLISATGCLAGLQGSTGSRPDMQRVLNKRVYCYVTVLAELLQAVKSLEVCVDPEPEPLRPTPPIGPAVTPTHIWANSSDAAPCPTQVPLIASGHPQIHSTPTQK